MRALVLSGGGANGAYQAAVIHHLHHVKQMRFDRVYGISVGALNACLVAQGDTGKILQVWDRIRRRDILRGKLNLWSLAKRFIWKRSLYDTVPLLKTIQREVDWERIRAEGSPELVIGAVDIINGMYRTRTPRDLTESEFYRWVAGSASIPIMFEPVRFRSTWLVDGGTRNITPLADIADADVTEAIVINCSPAGISLSSGLGKLKRITKRTVEIMTHEIRQNDVDTTVSINALVKQAENLGVKLQRHNGDPLRYINITTVQPETNLGDALDFSSAARKRRIQAGLTDAAAIFP